MLNSSGDPTSFSSDEVFATSVQPGFSKESECSVHFLSGPELHSGTGVVVKQHRIKQREISVKISQRGSNSKGGAFCQNQRIGGRWDSQESQIHINVLELKAIHLGLSTFVKSFNLKNVHRQHDSSGLPSENGRGKESRCSFGRIRRR